MKKKLLSLAQLLLGVGIIAFILFRLHSRGDLGSLRLALQSAADRWPFLALSTAEFGVCIFFCIVRWDILLRAQGVVLPFRRVASLYFVGQFFNAFLLGATGGDVVKAYYVATETHHKRAEVVATVFIDRIIGLLGLVLIMVTVMICRLRFFLSSAPMRLALAFVFFMVVGTLLGGISVFRRNAWERWAFLKRIEKQTRLGGLARRAYEAFRMCLGERWVVVLTMILSICNHLSFIAGIFYIGMALGLTLGFVDYLTVFMVINTIAAVPITPSGLGTRESACIFLLDGLGVSAATAVTLSLLIVATVLIWSLIGGIVYIFFTISRGRLPPPAVLES